MEKSLLIQVSPAERLLLLKIRSVAGEGANAAAICGVVETAINDAFNRPRSWEAEIGRVILRNALPKRFE